jgi:hypothetical protein
MRSVAAVALVYVLAVLLASTSPIGSGQGVHRDQLVDLLVPHTHYVNSGLNAGQVPRAVPSDPSPAPTVGASAGVSGTSLSIVLTLPVPDWATLTVDAIPTRLEPLGQERAPNGWHDPPPDPPPPAVS